MIFTARSRVSEPLFSFLPRAAIGLAAVLVIAMAAPAGAAPQIGDKAPPVKIAKWMTHEPPAVPGGKGADKHVFLIEFWATWCPPCLKSIPHLAELHTKHEKDRLIVIGVSDEEPETITKFILNKMKMPYYVASDDEMATTAAWTEGIQTIPHAFLVNKSGTVVWEGNPLDTELMDGVIKQVLAGKYDLEAARNAAIKKRKFDELMSELQPAYALKDRDKVFDLLDRMISLKPLVLQPYLIKREMLREFGMEDKIPAWEATLEDAMKDSAQAMRSLVQIELGRDFAERRPDFLLRCARRACDLNKQRDPQALSTLARVCCELGMIDAAIAAQTEAVDLASDEMKDRYKKVLDYFRAAKQVAEESRNAPKRGKR